MRKNNSSYTYLYMKKKRILGRIRELIKTHNENYQMDAISDDFLMEILEDYFAEILLSCECEYAEDLEETIEF